MTGGLLKYPALVAELGRARLSAAVALSALVGYGLAQPRVHPADAATLMLGLWLLSAGASALNQVQERDLDALMHRTRNRPLPSGRLGVQSALWLALATLELGTSVLYLSFGPSPALTGLGAVALYNLVYTPLKRRTAFALLPGALAGSLPVLIGWCAGGGRPADPRILMLVLLFFLWQIPHFQRLAHRHARDFERAALPCINRVLQPSAQPLILAVWVAAMATVAAALPALGLLSHRPAQWALALAGPAVALVCLCLVRAGSGSSRPALFGGVNLLMVLILAGLVLDRCWSLLRC